MKVISASVVSLCVCMGGHDPSYVSLTQDYQSTYKGLETPAVLMGPLYAAVQDNQLYPDSKTFADVQAIAPLPEIMNRYLKESAKDNFNLSHFVRDYFQVETVPVSGYITGSEDICTHIQQLWPVLTKQPEAQAAGSTLIALKYPYVVPGGRFREVYYWDSYFTMLGLRISGKSQQIRYTVQNFADLLRRFGHIPNGNRTYYLSRSQPPFLSLMVDLLAEQEGDNVYSEFLPALQREYAFWMEGADNIWNGTSYRRVVKLNDGSILNRYYDDLARPRDESWREDEAVAKSSNRPASEVFRNLRAAAESGWDFSSRWMKNPQDLTTIRTLDIAPVDLNSLLYHLEQVIARASVLAGRKRDAEIFTMRAAARKRAINTYLWNDMRGYFTDYIVPERRISDHITAASFYPLFLKISTNSQAGRVARAARENLLKPGGLVSTTIDTGQQWDGSNVWAPLQWIAVTGLENYKLDGLAQDIARNWTGTVVQNYNLTGALKEKYSGYQAALNAGGGEYPNQDGFGWTNGVFLALLEKFPNLPAKKFCISG